MDKENIKKALELNEYYAIEYFPKTGEPKVFRFNDILTLINELESENERLRNTEIGELIEENEKLAKQCEDWCEIILKKRNQIVKLKDRIAELEKENETKTDTITDLLKKQEFYEKEKLKQFAERLKEKKTKRLIPVGLDQPANEVWFIELTEEEIDETLKEFIKR